MPKENLCANRAGRNFQKNSREILAASPRMYVRTVVGKRMSSPPPKKFEKEGGDGNEDGNIFFPVPPTPRESPQKEFENPGRRVFSFFCLGNICAWRTLSRGRRSLSSLETDCDLEKEKSASNYSPPREIRARTIYQQRKGAQKVARHRIWKKNHCTCMAHPYKIREK